MVSECLWSQYTLACRAHGFLLKPSVEEEYNLRTSSCAPLQCPQMDPGLWLSFALKSDEGVYSCIVGPWQANAFVLLHHGR